MTDWAIPQQAKLKYTQLFNLHDRSHSGFLSGLQCRDILLQSGLPRNTLAEIWNLSDIDGDGQLTREEFILAMHLTNNVRSGQTLPNELPKELIPPSYRRPRSTSQSSVHSANSVTSAVPATSTTSTINTTNNNFNIVGNNSNNDDTQSQKSATETGVISSMASSSVLNSHSFEDKRRENFEKGRAELERRRIKIIEQQMSILREQLVNGKKSVSEAKSKIDVLRADRDTKMGMITFLEAQLKTLQDKKAYLHQEEVSLIAIAKDLNLFNDAAAQAELDEQATQAKQQSINEMKEKLKELAQEKEEKANELTEVNSRIEEFKTKIKTISETVTKTYETYKEVVQEAKVKREQFVNESRNQTADLDSVWDSAPTFSSKPALILTNQYSKFPETSATSSANPNDDPWGSTTNESTNINTTFSNAINLNNNNSTIDSPFSIGAMTLNNNISTKETDILAGNGFDSLKITEPNLIKRYKALYSFEARNPDELTIEPDDIIVGSEHVCEPGWLYGKCNNKTGLFPEAYVESIPNEITVAGQESKIELTATQPTILPTTTTTTSSNLTQFNPPTSQPIESLQSNTSSLISDPSSGAFKYKVIYAFDARNPDELTIKPGDIIIGLEGVTEPGWLSGRLDGRKGLFPEAYVEKLAASDNVQESHHPEPGALQRMSSVGSLRSKKSRSKSKAEVATVIANYRALGNEQLNLEKGQLVLIRRKTESGWWEGEIQVKGKKKQFGWFPASYVKLLSNNPIGTGNGGGSVTASSTIGSN